MKINFSRRLYWDVDQNKCWLQSIQWIYFSRQIQYYFSKNQLENKIRKCFSTRLFWKV